MSLKIIVVPIAWLCMAGSGLEKPVPVEQEPHHHLLFKNEFVTVVRATLLPGETTLYHTHSQDKAGFDFVGSTTTEQLLGQPEGPPSTSRAGEVYAESSGSNAPTPHRVHNVGTGPMDVLDVDLLQRPSQPNPHTAAPAAAENPSARVYNWPLPPGTTSAMHTHERPYLIVAVTPMHLKMASPDGRSLSENVKAGDLHWVDGRVTHSLSNAGSTPGQIVEIELK